MIDTLITKVVENAEYPVYVVACIFLARWYIKANERLLSSQDNTLTLVRQELESCHSDRMKLAERVDSLENENTSLQKRVKELERTL